MRYAILGDIHANLTALETVLDDAEKAGVGQIVSVGDVVGYGAAPCEAIRILREREAIVVKGNHDAACTGELDTTFFNPYARAAVDWTQQQLSDEDFAWLRGLPLTAVLPDLAVAHGTWTCPERYDYVQTIEDAEPSLAEQPRKVCFVGHTHVPVTLMRTNDDPHCTNVFMESEIDLSQAVRALVNIGSVGQPRDEDPRAAWGLFDSDTMRVEIKRLPYNIDVEAARIRDACLPGILADRLFLGI
ncbi:MAG: diadenosine tetraphosphatase ApaH/serine/threonine PP2A family protein phosphatase [Planctomycetota bacterium]|jgi:diadenosine tetraphosphatase ApaH/serine/threonine PP2A family protein phosphatase